MGMHKKRGRETVPMGDCIFFKNRLLLLPVKCIKCLSLCLVIQSEVKGLKVFPETASQGLLLFLANLTLPPVRLVRNIKDGFTGQDLPVERPQSQNKQYQSEPSYYSLARALLSITQRRHTHPLTLLYTISLAMSVTSAKNGTIIIKIVPILSD